MTTERVILVDERDRAIGTEDKRIAHVAACRHRAVSVFVFNSSGSLLLQQRALTKYHSGGLWSNTCCGHPRPGETVVAAARRRLAHEMGLGCRLHRSGALCYRAAVSGGLWEHEYDHLFVGITDRAPRPDAGEVSAWDWVDPGELTMRLRDTPEAFTPWLPLAGRTVSEWIRTMVPEEPPRPTGGAGSPSVPFDVSTCAALCRWSGLEWPSPTGLRD
jgi:isopentenyl-diphosphate delta-isomerase